MPDIREPHTEATAAPTSAGVYQSSNAGLVRATPQRLGYVLDTNVLLETGIDLKILPSGSEGALREMPTIAEIERQNAEIARKLSKGRGGSVVHRHRSPRRFDTLTRMRGMETLQPVVMRVAVSGVTRHERRIWTALVVGAMLAGILGAVSFATDDFFLGAAAGLTLCAAVLVLTLTLRIWGRLRDEG